MHHKVDDLLKNAGLTDRTVPPRIDSLFGTKATSQDQGSSGIQDVVSQIAQLQSSVQSNSDFVSTGSESPTQSTEAQTTSSGGLLSSLGGGATDVFGGGNLLEGLLGGGLLGDIFSGISGLFGGGQSQPPPLVPYDAPQSQDFELAVGGGQVGDAVYNQLGDPRVAPVTEPALSGLKSLGSTSSQAGDPLSSGGTSGRQSSPQITLNVQAMDSQSFLDRSQDIAHAVRQAMLNMHSINDVINDL